VLLLTQQTNNTNKQTKQTKPNATQEFESVRKALLVLGFEQKDIVSVWRVVAAILHLGNVNFTKVGFCPAMQMFFFPYFYALSFLLVFIFLRNINFTKVAFVLSFRDGVFFFRFFSYF
jgi:hypothetical protein